MTLNAPSGAAKRSVLTVTNPRDGSVTGSIETTPADRVEHVVRTARDAQLDWCAVEPAARGAALHAIAEGVRREAKALARMQFMETGRPESQALDGALAGANTLEQYAELGPLHQGNGLRGAITSLDLTIPEPRGVALILTPWNDPIAIACGLVGAALVTGNAVIHKPSEHCPQLGSMFGEIVAGATPDGVFQTAIGGSELGSVLSQHQRVDVIAHVGSSASGARIARVAALTGAHFVRENGGNDPLIVDADVDPQWAAEQAAIGAFINSGQLCTAVERIYAHRDAAHDFAAALVEQARDFPERFGWGPLIDAELRQRVHQHVTEAIADGAELAIGGEVPDGKGWFYPPTVLTGCRQGMTVMREETFGPVAPIAVVDSWNDAIAAANDDKYGLSATALTGSTRHALQAAHELSFGTVKINAVFGGAPGGSAQPRRASGSGFGYGPGLLSEMTTAKVVHFEAAPAGARDEKTKRAASRGQREAQ